MADISLTFSANTAPFLNGVKEIRASVTTLSQTLKEKRAEIVQFYGNLSMVFHGVKSVSATVGKALSAPLAEFTRWEDAATRLAPLVGGLEAAKHLCEELRDEAANGTMSFEQLASVAGRLSSVFKSSSDIKKWTTAFHDLSAGTGLDINELIGNFVKSKASGRFEAGFLDMFAQKGVNIFPELVKQTGVAETELRKMAAAGTLSFAEVEKAILAVSTGTGQFAGQAAALSNTFGGSAGTMLANWKILLAEFAKPIAESLTPWLQSVGKFLSENKALAERFGAALANVGAVVATLAVGFKGLHGSISSAFFATNPLVSALVAFGGIASLVGFEKWVQSMKEETAAAEKSIAVNQRLQRSFEAMEKAANPQQLKEAEKEARRIATDLYVNGGSSLNFDVIRKNIKLLRERKTAELELAEATRKRVEADVNAAENNRRAQELWAKISNERKSAADKRALDVAPVEVRPGLFLQQHGFESYEKFSDWLNNHRARMDDGLASGNGSEWLVNEVNRLEQLNEQYFTLVDAANNAAAEAAAKEREKVKALELASAAYERQKALFEAEISGNAKILAQEKAKARYAELVSQYKSQGFNEADSGRMAQKILRLEMAKESLSGEDPGTRIGHGLVADELAGVGGGRSLQIGGNENAAVSVARSQLTVQQRIDGTLRSIDGSLQKSLQATFA
ncbi:MAG: hypothetical protein J6L64_01485 [Opitutales bacterium]|nr:hypothetical protein [Opitutales bacterium]